MSAASKPVQTDDAFAQSPAQGTLTLSRLLPGSPADIWPYLTESDKSKEWFAAIDGKIKKGSTITLRFDNSTITPHNETTPEKYKEAECGGVGGTILVLEPPHRLSYTWGKGSEVTFELTAQGNNTLLRLTHKNISERGAQLSIAAGWHSHLDVLQDKLNGKIPAPFWEKHARLMEHYEQVI